MLATGARSIGAAVAENPRCVASTGIATSPITTPTARQKRCAVGQRAWQGWNKQCTDYRLPFSGIVLNRHCAIDYLQRLCAARISGVEVYFQQAERFAFRQDPVSALWTGTVELPEYVHPDYRFANSTRAWKSKLKAQQDVSLRALVNLHEAGMINDCLQPVLESFQSTTRPCSPSDHEPIQITSHVSGTAWTSMSRASMHHECEWHPSTITVRVAHGNPLIMTMWTPRRPIPEDTFQLYLNDATCLRVDVANAKETCRRDPEQLRLMHETTRQLLKSAALRFPASNDFAVLFTPATYMCPQERPSSRSKDSTSTTTIAQQHDDSARCSQLDQTSFAKLIPRIVERVGQTLAIPRSRVSFPERIAVKHCSTVRELLEMMRCSNMRSTPHKSAKALKKRMTSLKVLGTAVLQLLIDLQLITDHPTRTEAWLHLERNRKLELSHIATRASESHVIRHALPGKFNHEDWMIPHASQQAPSTVKEHHLVSRRELRNVVRAVIGAAFVDGDLGTAYSVASSLLPSDSKIALENLFDKYLAQAYQREPVDVAKVGCLEALIGYKFDSPGLLAQAVNHRSDASKTTPSYEPLEYLGDSVLAVVLGGKLHRDVRLAADPEKMTVIFQALSSSHFLSFCCLRHRTVPKSSPVSASKSHSEDRHLLVQNFVGIYSFVQEPEDLRLLSAAAVERYEDMQRRAEHAQGQVAKYPGIEFSALKIPKRFADVVESILGAIFLDSRGAITACEAFLEELGVFSELERLLVQPEELRELMKKYNAGGMPLE